MDRFSSGKIMQIGLENKTSGKMVEIQTLFASFFHWKNMVGKIYREFWYSKAWKIIPRSGPVSWQNIAHLENVIFRSYLPETDIKIFHHSTQIACRHFLKIKILKFNEIKNLNFEMV